MDTKRFHTPEYKKQIKAVRTYRRQVSKKPETSSGKFFYALGLQSWISKVLVVLVLALLVYLVYFAQFLKITDYDISGVDTPARQGVTDQLEKFASGSRYLMPQRNILFFNIPAFSANLLANDQQIAKVDSIRKSFWHKLVIVLEQRVPAFVLQTPENSYTLNSDGSVGDQRVAVVPDNSTGPTGATTLDASSAATVSTTAVPSDPTTAPVTAEMAAASQFPIITDTANDEVKTGEYFFNAQEFAFLKYVQQNFKDATTAAVQSYEVPGQASEQLIVYTDKGYKVLFADTADPKEYLQRLVVIMHQLTPADLNKLAYVDLRFEKNAYTCYKGDPCSQ